MKIFSKRIAILWTAYSLKDNNGVYHFTRSFLKIAEKNNWKVDIIFDKKSDIKGQNSYPELESLGARLLFPSKPLDDSISKDYYSFTTGVSLIELANLQKGLLEALQTNLYDLVICEPFFTSIVSQLSSLKIPVMWYTHNPGSVTGEYNDDNTELFTYIDKISSNCIIGTQTEYNQSVLKARGIDSVVLPLPFPDLEIFKATTLPKKGILFCGTTEARKQFDLFFNLIVETKLPAKIMTSKLSGEKMLKQFKDAGITDVEVRNHILGEEKRDFFASSMIFFTPSTSESFGYALAEAIPHTNAVALDYEWTNNFDNNFCHIIPKEDYILYIKSLYEVNPPLPQGAMQYVESMHNNAEIAWANFINNRTSTIKKFSKGFAETHRNFWLSDLASLIKRPLLSLDEINPLLARKDGNALAVTYTDEDTWISLDNIAPVEKEKSVLESLFG